MYDFKITPKQATQLVLNFLTQRNLIDFAQTKSIGGVISKDSMRYRGIDFSGTMAWFCWKANPPFLAFEDGVYNPDTVKPDTPPTGSKLMRSQVNLTYSSPITFQDVEALIAKPVTLASDAEIDATEVVKLSGGIPYDAKGVSFNKYPFGFFENRDNHDVDEFLDQVGLTHVKYLYGFDDSDEYHEKTNRIRIVLVGIKSDGTPVQGAPLQGTPGVLTDPIVIQKSWPPPPNS